MDIPKFCKSVLSTQKNDEELQGKVVTCLRKQFIVKVVQISKKLDFVKIYRDRDMLFYICFSNVKNTKQIIFIYTILQKLSRDCNDVIRNIIKDSAHNYMEDPVLASTCEREVHIYVYSSSMVLNLLSFIFETCHDHFVVFLDYLNVKITFSDSASNIYNLPVVV